MKWRVGVLALAVLLGVGSFWFRGDKKEQAVPDRKLDPTITFRIGADEVIRVEERMVSIQEAGELAEQHVAEDPNSVIGILRYIAADPDVGRSLRAACEAAGVSKIQEATYFADVGIAVTATGDDDNGVEDVPLSLPLFSKPQRNVQTMEGRLGSVRNFTPMPGVVSDTPLFFDAPELANEELRLHVDSSGQVFEDGFPLTREELREQVESIVAAPRRCQVSLTSSPSILETHVPTLVVVCAKAGASSVGWTHPSFAYEQQ